MFQSANVHGIAPAVIATACLGLLLSIRRRHPQPRRFWPRFAAAGVVALALAAAKLAAAMAFLSSFPRSGYPLPGADGLLSALRLATRALFGSAPEALAAAVDGGRALPDRRQELGSASPWCRPSLSSLAPPPSCCRAHAWSAEPPHSPRASDRARAS